MTSVPPTHSQPRSIPSLWTKLELENRSPEFPDIYTAPSHSKVPEGHGTIYIVIASINPADLHHMFTHGAKFSSFCGLDEAAAKGMPALRPSLNDFLVFHDKYRKEEDGDSKDIVKSWSRSKQEFTTPVLGHFQELQEDVYSKDNLMTDTKAVLVDGKYHGGIALERSFCSEFHVRNAQRAYHLTTSFQKARGLEAPHRSNKVDRIKEKDHKNMLHQRVNELAIRTTNEGLRT
ncbi:hypothetical protein ARMGADRAFT_1083168 [Armillaria gallica]|uniref:Uncharacterized protein n=1 Tax=Armillaria gallica TaxID=47427 RepID=A0A2H3DPX2_ARMGA|nr:hypothetical protein ARMGADRAFT_1083168 [Armillaria gallica]